jgi:hypothetical protein
MTGSLDYPHTQNAYQQKFAGGERDLFISKLDEDLSANPSLMVDVEGFPAGAGGTVDFTLTAGDANAGRNYLLLGGVSGTAPGTSLPGGLATLPINWDALTEAIVVHSNTTLFTDFYGTLDAKGSGSARLNAPPVPRFAGTVMHFAYFLDAPCNFASNPVAIEILP